VNDRQGLPECRFIEMGEAATTQHCGPVSSTASVGNGTSVVGIHVPTTTSPSKYRDAYGNIRALEPGGALDSCTFWMRPLVTWNYLATGPL
jgi:hypothetical protein